MKFSRWLSEILFLVLSVTHLLVPGCNVNTQYWINLTEKWCKQTVAYLNVQKDLKDEDEWTEMISFNKQIKNKNPLKSFFSFETAAMLLLATIIRL